jgi:signal peptidase I
MRAAVEMAVVLGIVSLLAGTWLVAPRTVVSGSMADTLLGRHRQVVCGDCRFAFDCGTDGIEQATGRAVCPNCGSPHNTLDELSDLPGDRVLIDRTAFLRQRPRRWEPVAFRLPPSAAKVAVKRVVGLPGEAVQLIDGDVMIDGQIARKSLAQQQALAVLVHDHRFRAEGLPSRWVGGGPWRADGDGFRHQPSARPNAANEADFAWLSYRHWRRVPGLPEQVVHDDVHDDHGYNQTLPRLDGGQAARDLGLRCRLRTASAGQISLLASDARAVFQAILDSSTGQARLLADGREVATVSLPAARFACPTSIEMWLSDQQFLLALDGVLLFPPQLYDRPDEPAPLPAGVSRGIRLAIGARAEAVAVDELRVFRDVCYTQPAVAGRTWGIDEPYVLAANEYFVLGDNSVISEDSRVWGHETGQGPAVASELLVGRPVAVFLPGRRQPWTSWGGWRIQVPELPSFRYIR